MIYSIVFLISLYAGDGTTTTMEKTVYYPDLRSCTEDSINSPVLITNSDGSTLYAVATNRCFSNTNTPFYIKGHTFNISTLMQPK